MLTARDIMTTDVITLAPDNDIQHAVKVLIGNKINGCPVVDETGRLLGVLCQSDLVAQQKKLTMPSFFTLLDGIFPVTASDDMDREIRKIAATTVAEAMTEDPVTVNAATPIDEIATTMVNEKLYTLPVVDAGKLVGVVGKEDILRTLTHGDA